MMAGRGVIPLRDMQQRLPEHGRIRLGVKGTSSRGKVIPTSIDTFRFTSPDRGVIEELAGIYGGEPRPWSDPKASPKDQWEVITEATDLRIWLKDSNALSVWYELWAGKGCVRRCDGIICQVPITEGPDEGGWDERDCICAASNNMECRPYSRLQVILPDVTFGGSWRLETKGWNAAAELPEMERMLQMLASHGILEARLRLESRQAQGGRKQFVVPVLVMGKGMSPEAIAGGGGSALAAVEAPAPVAAIESGSDDDIVEAEIIEGPWGDPTDLLELRGTAEHRLMLAAKSLRLEPDRFEAPMVQWASKGETQDLLHLRSDQLEKLIDACSKLVTGDVTFRGVGPIGAMLARKKAPDA